MNIFNVISLLGGLAMFLYGMRLMGNSLKESSSGTLKVIMEKVTNNVISAFFLGLAVTALIQSSTATIVITSGLVAAGIITLRQSLGIIIGANVGTTVTGQIIRLLDLNDSSVSWLQIFKPSTLAPVALVVGIILIMFVNSKKSDQAGSIAVGFGILFSGLMNMTNAVSALNESGMLEPLFMQLGNNPFLGYATGAGVAFVLQSSSATIGILQAFAMTGGLTFKGIYAVIVGIYLGDCVTTAIVCSIGAKPDAKRVGIVNILFNLSETVLVLLVVGILHRAGALDALWDKTVSTGDIANTNTVFNLGCAFLLLPFVRVYEKISRKIVKDETKMVSMYADKLEALNPNFFLTPAIAFRSCYDALLSMFDAARKNIDKSYAMLVEYDDKVFDEIAAEEENIDIFADRISHYLVQFSPYIKSDLHVAILNQYYKIISEFERLGDHAVNISETAEELHKNRVSFSAEAVQELMILKNLLNQILDYTYQAFLKRDAEAAKHIEPLEEVVDDMINALKDNHLIRLRKGECNVVIDSIFLNLLGDIERISDVCSNVGIAVIARVEPEIAEEAHDYISQLHQGHDADFNRIYTDAHDMYFGLLNEGKEKKKKKDKEKEKTGKEKDASKEKDVKEKAKGKEKKGEG